MNTRKHSRGVYVVPLVHLTIYFAALAGMLLPSLSWFDILPSVLMLADFPIVSAVTFMLVWGHPVLSTIWMGIAGTLWWYLLSLLAQALFRKKQIQAA